MKKFGKFVLGMVSCAAVAGGVWYFFKNVLNKDKDEFEDFDDDFEEDFEEFEDFEDDVKEVNDDIIEEESREYVKINMADSREKKEDEEISQEEESKEE